MPPSRIDFSRGNRPATEHMMHHFPADHWIDFSRNLLPAGGTEEMQAHLESGCEECRKSYDAWRLVMEWSSRERFYHPPSDVVRVVKAAFVPERRIGWLAQLAHFAALTFDSFKGPALVGIRAGAQTSRQLIHEAAPFTIDLKLESDAARRRTYLVGQILNADSPEQSVAGVEVVLLRGPQLVTRTLANAAGEFELNFMTEDELQLFINIRGEKAIGVQLPAPGI